MNLRSQRRAAALSNDLGSSSESIRDLKTTDKKVREFKNQYLLDEVEHIDVLGR